MSLYAFLMATALAAAVYARYMWRPDCFAVAWGCWFWAVTLRLVSRGHR